MKILVLDNYDSFTYNLVYLLRKLAPAAQVDVFRNDKISLKAVGNYDKILLSPGPGLPEEAGIMPDLIKQYASKIPILGVCLGHQAIGEAFGARLTNIPEVLHGIQSTMQVKHKDLLFKDLEKDEFLGAHYHSWVVEKSNLPNDFEILAEDTRGLIMAMRHKKYDVVGVQFHPESVLTPEGEKMVRSWLGG